jgi:ABC-type xylose transport system permease subunit
MTLRTTFDRFFARDREREARAHGQTELAEAYRQYGRQRLIAVIGLGFTLALMATSVAQLVFNYSRPMPWPVLALFLVACVGAFACSWGRR